MNATTVQEHEVLELETISRPGAAPVPSVPQGGALADNSPMSMMLAAQRQGATLADVREMMVIHREMKADEAREAFRSDFADFRGENVIIPKTKHVDRGRGGSFIQAEYDEVCRRLSPALSRHGFSFRHDQKFGVRRIMTDGVESDVGWVWVTCHLEHRRGHAERLELEGPPGELSVNTPTQNMQTTASYLKRQSLLAITGTATGGEDDENEMRGEDDYRGARGGDQRSNTPPPATYPDAQFRENLPKWREVIAAGRKTPDQIISMAQTKHPLTDEQKRAIHESPRASGPTYAHVADQLNRAGNEDALNVAADLIKDVADAAHRTELNALFDKRRAELNA
ncbi:hypothetical protein ABL850_15795 [Variovorax paradoxus]|uniref:hypothetical protein n=1 Tax=Variovorax paradoxus TaxID=34073 RepID=UPI0003FCFD58